LTRIRVDWHGQASVAGSLVRVNVVSRTPLQLINVDDSACSRYDPRVG